MAAAGFAPLKPGHQRSAQCQPSAAAFPSSPFPLSSSSSISFFHFSSLFSFLPLPPFFLFFYFFLFPFSSLLLFLSLSFFFSRHRHCDGGTAGQGGRPDPTKCLLDTDRSHSLGLEPDGHAVGSEPTYRSQTALVQRRADWWPSPQLPDHSDGRSGRVAWIGRGSPAPFPSSVSLSRKAARPRHGHAQPSRGSAEGHPHPSHPLSLSLSRGRTAVHRPAIDQPRVTLTLPILCLPLYFSLASRMA